MRKIILPIIALAASFHVLADGVSGKYSSKTAVAEITEQQGAVEFQINSSVGDSACMLDGVAKIIDESRAVYSPSAADDKCVVVLNFAGGALKVTTKDCDAYCGGNAVGSMDGDYTHE
jgi:hypothetical protein